MGSIITLLTDFGLEDPYVGTMKGIIYTINPAARLVDLSHSVQPQKVEQGAFLLSNSYRYFPPSTVHLAVVDPGVGTSRRAIGLRVAEVGTFVGPDNGLFSHILAEAAAKGKVIVAHELSNESYRLGLVSSTFHGRDIFAPAAAHLAQGVALEDFGTALSLEELKRIDVSVPEWERKKAKELLEVKGSIVHIDHFGNLITNLPASLFAELKEKQKIKLKLKCGPFTVTGLNETYNQKRTFLSNGYNLINLVSSSGYLEVARVDGNAKELLNAKIGGKVTVQVSLSGD